MAKIPSAAIATCRRNARALRADADRREDLRVRLGRYLDVPMALVSVLMVLLAFVQLGGKISRPWQGTLAAAQWILWALFAAEFLAKLTLAPHKRVYLRRHWLDLLLVIFPFVAFLRILVIARALPLVRLVLVGSRSVSPYLAILKRRKLGRLAVSSCLVILIAALLEFIFEDGAPHSTIGDFGDALWWAAATATTIGNQLYPVTIGGKIVAFLLMLYAIGVFSYLTSSIASALIAGDSDQSAVPAQQSAPQTAQPAPTAPVPTAASANGSIHLSQEQIETLQAILAQAKARA